MTPFYYYLIRISSLYQINISIYAIISPKPYAYFFIAPTFYNFRSQNLLVADVDLSGVDVDQCGPLHPSEDVKSTTTVTSLVTLDGQDNETTLYNLDSDLLQGDEGEDWKRSYVEQPKLTYFHGTHKCRSTTEVSQRND